MRTFRSRDLDETRHLVASVFCDHGLEMPSGIDGLDYWHQHTSMGDIGFSLIRYGVNVRISCASMDSFYLVQLPLAGHDRQVIDGKDVASDMNCATVHGLSEDLQMDWSQDCRKLIVRIERSLLEKKAHELNGRPLNRPLAFRSSMSLRDSAGAAWCRTAQHIYQEIRRAPELYESPLMQAQFEHMLVTSLLAWQPSSLSDGHEKPAARILPRHVKSVVDYIQAYPEQPMDLGTLTAIAGCSARSLNSRFHENLGISPMRYLRELRMEKARQDLLDPQKPRSVTDVAMHWGFYQLGRFAHDYRQRFNESPRDTLLHGR
jgi:AraC-like DNA-binding protein